MTNDLSKTFETLWTEYVTLCPSALRIHDLLTNKGNLVNDHIAFRTFDDQRVNSQVLADHFIELGYEEKGQYRFEQKKLSAIHLEHSDLLAPKVFISELIVSEFSPGLQETVHRIIEEIPDRYYGDPELVFRGRLWNTPSYRVYEELRAESEYAAWMYVYGFCANHFTVFVNHLSEFPHLSDLNDFLVQNGFSMNSSGGLIKGGPEVYLEQSSIMADRIAVEFQEGPQQIPGCYYEFAYRYERNGELFNGFVAQSADKIFESTDKKEVS